MPVSNIEWSKAEEQVAQAAFGLAYEREVQALMEEVRQKAATVIAIDEIWHLHDFLSAKRHDLDGKYDYRYSELIFVFSRLVKEGWLDVHELDGLAPDKLTKITLLAQM